MYVGIDVGGTKTLVGVLNEHGEIVEKLKFLTPENYDEFLKQLKETLTGFKHHDFKAGGIAIPGALDRKHGRIEVLGNLPWRNEPVLHDVEKITHCPMVLENDAKLAALSEAMLLKHEYSRSLYVTVSTGIGYGLVVDGIIDTNSGDGGGRAILLEHNGKRMSWEDFASGRAIVNRYHKRAVDITDEATWKAICRDLAKGLVHLIAILEPDVIVVGGSVGSYFDRYKHLLKDEIAKYHVPMMGVPALRQAQRPEEAVLFGCYDLAKQKFKHADHH